MGPTNIQPQAMMYQELERQIANLESERRAKRDELARIDREIYEMIRRKARVEYPPIAA